MYATGHIKDVTLGIIGTGTGSDYIRTIGISPDYQEACEHLMHPQSKSVDLGIVEYKNNGNTNNRLFANFAGMGFDAEVVRTTTRKFKSLGSKPSYLLGLLSTFLTYKNQKIRLKIDGQEDDRKICTIVMSNGKYGGGSMMVAPEADPGDGLFDVIIIGDVSKPDLLWSLPRIYKGTHLTHPKVTLKRAKKVEIYPENLMAVQADGELLGSSPASFSILASALNIYV